MYFSPAGSKHHVHKNTHRAVCSLRQYRVLLCLFVKVYRMARERVTRLHVNNARCMLSPLRVRTE